MPWVEEPHYVVFKVGEFYAYASSLVPDQHYHCAWKETAWLKAREALREDGHDPSAVLDLTNVPLHELSNYYR